MAKSRTCLASSVCCDDDFRDLPHGAQALYIQLCFEADNDGVVNNAKSLLRATGIEKECLDALVEDGYLLKVNGCFVVTHWWVNNKKDSLNYRAGNHPDVVSQIEQISEQNRMYHLIEIDQSDIRLTSVANISKYKQSEKKISEANPSEVKPNKRDSSQAENTPLAPCPICGKYYPMNTTKPFTAFCEIHGSFDP